jgi:hemolysin III
MTMLIGSYRLANVRAPAVAPCESTAASAAVSSMGSIADFGSAPASSVPTIDFEPWLPGLETAERLTQALQRAAQSICTFVKELEEESLNAITHGLGFAMSAVGFAYLLTSVVLTGGWLRVASCGVYGASLMLMYAASTFFHAAQRPHLKLRFQLFDHVAIYLLIAGTYTPFLASLMEGYMGFALLACVWALAAIGIAIKVKFAKRLEATSPLPCVALGWLGLAAIKSLVAVVPIGGMALLLAGGASYSAGVVFYCRDDNRYFHVIWHLFVMAGTAFHFCAILLYIAI